MLVWQFFKTSSWYFCRFFIPVINKLLSWKLSVKQTGYGFLLRFKAANHPCRKVLVTQSGSRCKNCSFKLFAPTRHIVFAKYVFFLPFSFCHICFVFVPYLLSYLLHIHSYLQVTQNSYDILYLFLYIKWAPRGAFYAMVRYCSKHTNDAFLSSLYKYIKLQCFNST